MPCSRSARRPSVNSEKSIGPALRLRDAAVDGVDLILVDAARVVQQASDQRALPVVHAPGGADAQQIRHQK